MANRLNKLAEVQYTPGTPYVPARPAYCTSVSYTTNELVVSGGGTVVYDDGQTTITTGDTLSYEPRTTTTKTCYPAVPEQLGTQASVTYTAINGWNGGGRSIDPLTGDGAFRFQVSSVPSAVVVGLSGADTSTLPNEPSHAFYVHGTTVEVLESGVSVATSANPHAYATPLAISRSAGTVTYLHGNWSYTSAVASVGDQHLDAAIYASGDYVDNPELLAPLALNGRAVGTLPPLFGVSLGEGVTSYSRAAGILPALFGGSAGLTGEVGGVTASLPLLLARASDYPYSAAEGGLPLLSAYGDGGFPQVSLITAVGALPPLATWGYGYTGEVGSASGSLPLIAAQGSDRAGYGAASGSLPLLWGMGLALADTGDNRADNSYLAAGDFYTSARRPSGYAQSALTVQDSYTLSMLVDGTVFDSLALSDSTSAYRLLTALAQSGLLLGTDSSTGNVAAQYAVNVLSNALTTYDGFDFLQFARTDTAVYAVRSDGLYRLRPGDDNGSPISVYVDFGETEFGSVKAKTVEQVFLGLSTDGDVLVTLRSDDGERTYRAIQRGPLLRVNAARGVTARRWNLTLEVVDATELELDTVEQLIAVSTRRWTR